MITAYRQTRLGNTVVVTVTSSLSGTVYYHWYSDGQYVATSQTPSHAFLVPTGGQARIEVVDTLDADFDPRADAPDGWPARRSLWWVRSLAQNVEHYRIEEQEDGGEWSVIGRVWATGNQWGYSVTTGRLTDLAEYAWRVIPVDEYGNDGTPLALGPETIVRTPDAPDFAIAFDAGTGTVTFTEAAV